MKRIDVHLGEDPDSMKVYEMANSKKLPVRYVSEWVLKNAKKGLVKQIEEEKKSRLMSVNGS